MDGLKGVMLTNGWELTLEQLQVDPPVWEAEARQRCRGEVMRARHATEQGSLAELAKLVQRVGDPDMIEALRHIAEGGHGRA